MLRLLQMIVGTLVLFVPLSLFAENLELEWTPTPGSPGYAVQIRAPGQQDLAVDQRVEEPRISFDLAPGQYQVRVAALNRFNRPSRWSAWRPITIKRARPPVVTSVSPNRIGIPPTDNTASAEDLVDISILGEHFVPAMQARLENRDGLPIQLKTVQIKSKKVIVVTAARSAFQEGAHDLVIESPGGFKKRLSAAVVAEPKEPNESGAYTDETQELEAVDAGGFEFSRLVPGLPAFQGERVWSGIGWLTAFSAASFLTYSAYVEVEDAVATPSSSGFYPSLSNPGYLLALASLAGSSPDTTTVGGLYLLGLNQENAARTSYNSSAQRYSLFAGALALVYVTHLLWAEELPGQSAGAQYGRVELIGCQSCGSSRDTQHYSLGFGLRF